MYARARARGFNCVPGEVRRSLLGSFGSSGGCTVTTCTRPYRHFRHPRASTSLQLDGSNWTTNGHVVIRTRHLSATPFALCLLLSPQPPSPRPAPPFELQCRIFNRIPERVSRDAPLLLLLVSIDVVDFRIFDPLPPDPKRVSFSRNLERTWNLDRRRSHQFFIDLSEVSLPRNDISAVGYI